MNILPINLQNNNKAKRSVLNNSHVIQPKYAHTLERDTVSFGSHIIPSRGATKIAEFVTQSVAQNSKRMERIATTYLDVLESVASKLNEIGISFDRAYCELNPVKSPESYTSKIVRSKNFKVPDTIRATLYMKEPYDLSFLYERLLPEMRKRGYVLADTEMPVKDLMKRGYIPSVQDLSKEDMHISVPDLDIRLEDVSDQLSKLPLELKYSIGKPQKSGYEDIQMRFVRDFDVRENPVQHELIILFGKNYAEAKHIESEKVYSHLRKFDELNMKFEDKTIGSNSLRAHRYVELIKQMFRGKVSQKLFMNAKNKDLYDINDELAIHFSEDDINRLSNYFIGLKNRLSVCYKDAKNSVGEDRNLISKLKTNQRQDSTLLKEIQNGLNDTIEYFNGTNGANHKI